VVSVRQRTRRAGLPNCACSLPVRCLRVSVTNAMETPTDPSGRIKYGNDTRSRACTLAAGFYSDAIQFPRTLP
jgi:hypothetical protein